ncbi:hypothetical protein QU487_20635 [Crenobacter sp. SG2305]|uniref:hypothetical protein n=1 Tax=Crenobacter oryzisoli TaxID=3056844 RepID=UPI0025AA80AD|nr:hypothetical protein [Crenobacter sp. SG2305]MDN0085118.1 hypothetical protein [Crenobacter sp. SG2305]
MFVAAFRNPGDYGGLAPMYNIEDGKLLWDLTLDNFHRLVEEPIYFELFVNRSATRGLPRCCAC